MIKLTLLWIIFFFPTLLYSQQDPTKDDLLIAYCRPILIDQLNWYETILPKIPEIRREFYIQQQQELNQRFNKIDQFLISRLDFLKNASLVAATKAGELDVTSRKKNIQYCLSKYADKKSSSKCVADFNSSIELRIKRCDEQILPY